MQKADSFFGQWIIENLGFVKRIRTLTTIERSVCFRWLFRTGRLAPEWDYFNCVVNIPEDIHKVHELGTPSEGHAEQMAVLTAGQMGPLYGAAGLVGKDEMNGRVNPALETDEELDMKELERIKSQNKEISNPFKNPHIIQKVNSNSQL